MAIGDIVLKIVTTGAGQAAGEARAVSESLKDVEKSAAGASAGADKLSSALGKVAHYTIGGLGVSAIAQMASSLSDASLAAIKLQNSLNFVTGSAKAGYEAIEYLRQTSNRLGADFSAASAGFAKFAAAAQGTGISMDQVKATFESVAKASVVLGLSSDETNGAMLALSQMMSKGTVSAEELRGQLGERLPGAFNIAARAMGVSTAELGKMLEQGALATNDFLPKFAAEMEKTFGAAAGEAANSAIANVNRLSSSWAQFKQELGTATNASGRPTWLIDALNEASASMRQATKDGKPLIGILASIGGFLAGGMGVGKFDDAAKAKRALELQEKIKSLESQTQNTLAFDIPAKTKTELKDAWDELAEIWGSGVIKLKSKGELKELAEKDLAGAADALKKSGILSDAWNSLYQTQAQKKASAVAALDAQYTKEAEKYRFNQEMLLKLTADYQVKREQIEKQFSEKKTSGKGGLDKELEEQRRAMAESLGLHADFAKKLAALDREYHPQSLDANSEAMNGYRAAVEKLIAKQPYAIALEKEQAEALKKLESAQTANTRAAVKEAESIAEQVQKQREHNEEIGLSAEALFNLQQSRLDATIAAAEQLEAEKLLTGAASEEIAAIWEKIDGLKALKKARAEGYQKESADNAAKETAAEWKKSSDDINRSLTDALMRGFESGKGFSQNLRDTIVNMFKTMELRPIISAVLSPVSGAIAAGMGSLGMSGAAGAADIGGYANLFSGGSSLYSGLTSGSGFLGSVGNLFGMGASSVAIPEASSFAAMAGLNPAVSAFGTGAPISLSSLGMMESTVPSLATSLVGAESGAALAAATAETTTAMAAAGEAATGFAGTLGTLGAALPYLGAALGALSLMGLFDHKGGPKVGSSSYMDQFGNIQPGEYNGETFNRTSSGGDPFKIKDMTAGLVKDLSGVANKFGKTLGDEFRFGLQAELDPQGTTPGTVGYMVNGKTVTTQLDGKNQEAGAKELGVMAQRAMLDALSQLDLSPVVNPLLDSIKDFGSLSEQEAQQALAAVTEIASMSTQQVNDIFGEAFDVSKFAALSGEGETTIATFSRLSKEFSATNAVAKLLGKDTATAFGAVGLASAQAREGLIAAAGGLDALASKTENYYQKMFTDTERGAMAAAEATKQLNAGFGELGMAVPDTIAGFRALVDGLDLTSEAGQSAYNALMGLVDAFTEVHGTAQGAASGVSAAAAGQFGFSGLGSAGYTLPYAAEFPSGMTDPKQDAGRAQLEQTLSAQVAAISTMGELIDSQYSDAASAAQLKNSIISQMIETLSDLPNQEGMLYSYETVQKYVAQMGGIAETINAVYALEQQYQGHGQEVFELNAWKDQQIAAIANIQSTLPEVYAALASGIDETYQEKLDAILNGTGSSGGTSDIANSRRQMEINIMELQGRAAEALAAKREMELAAMDASLRSLQQQIYALEDARTAVDNALKGVQNAVKAERDAVSAAYKTSTDAVNDSIKSVNESVSKLSSLSSSLKSTIDSMSVPEQSASDYAAARADLTRVLGDAINGIFPESSDLTKTLNIVSKPDENLYATREAYLQAFQTGKNDMEALQALTDNQLSTEEKTLDTLKAQLDTLKKTYDDQMKAFDAVLEDAQHQVNALYGIDDSVKSVADAVEALTAALTGAANAGIGATSGASNTGTADLPGGYIPQNIAQYDNEAALASRQLVLALTAGASATEAQRRLVEDYNAATQARTDAFMAWLATDAGKAISAANQAMYEHPSFAIGTNYVPGDMTANIHEGERIIPAADNRELMERLRNPDAANAVLISEIRALRAELQAGQIASVQAQQKTAKILEKFDGDGMPAVRTV